MYHTQFGWQGLCLISIAPKEVTSLLKIYTQDRDNDSRFTGINVQYMLKGLEEPDGCGRGFTLGSRYQYKRLISRLSLILTMSFDITKSELSSEKQRFEDVYLPHAGIPLRVNYEQV